MHMNLVCCVCFNTISFVDISSLSI